jgi:hypothetical protein
MSPAKVTQEKISVRGSGYNLLIYGGYGWTRTTDLSIMSAAL